MKPCVRLLFVVFLFMQSTSLHAQENRVQLEFFGSVSKQFRINIFGSTDVYTAMIYMGEEPFTTSDGYCYLTGISHDMDQQAVERSRVYTGHRSPFFYHIGFNETTLHWGVSAMGGAAGSSASFRCVKL